MQGAEPDDKTRDLIGQIAAVRATLALTRTRQKPSLPSRAAPWSICTPTTCLPLYSYLDAGVCLSFQGDRAAASQAFTEALSISQASGNIVPP